MDVRKLKKSRKGTRKSNSNCREHLPSLRTEEQKRNWGSQNQEAD